MPRIEFPEAAHQGNAESQHRGGDRRWACFGVPTFVVDGRAVLGATMRPICCWISCGTENLFNDEEMVRLSNMPMGLRRFQGVATALLDTALGGAFPAEDLMRARERF